MRRIGGGIYVLVRRIGRVVVEIASRFERNHGMIRAAGLSYMTLLGLIPLLAFTLSVATSVLQETDARQIEDFIGKTLSQFAPQLNLVPADVLQPVGPEVDGDSGLDGAGGDADPDTEGPSEDADDSEVPAFGPEDSEEPRNGALFAERIHELIGNIHSGALRATAIIVLVVIVVSLLRSVESTLNAIWRAPNARGWTKSIVYYWTTITLGPLLLAMGLGLTAANRFEAAKNWLLKQAPEMGGLAIAHVSPLALLVVGFTFFYLLMPNTRVRFLAAFGGGMFTGALIHVNSSFGATFYSRQGDAFAKIYGGLVAIPMLMAGVFVAWIIVLIGAEVAYAIQHHRDYASKWESWRRSSPDPHSERLAIAVMVEIAKGFHSRKTRLDAEGIARRLKQPQELVDRAIRDLVRAELVGEIEQGSSSRWIPGKPLSEITLMDVASASRFSPEMEAARPTFELDPEIEVAWTKIRAVEGSEAERYTILDFVGSVANTPKNA